MQIKGDGGGMIIRRKCSKCKQHKDVTGGKVNVQKAGQRFTCRGYLG